MPTSRTELQPFAGFIHDWDRDGSLLNGVVAGERNETPESQGEGVEHLGTRVQPGGRIH